MSEIVWTNQYSDTAEHDRMGRWARIPSVNGVNIGWVSMVKANGPAMAYLAHSYLPTARHSHSPTVSRTFDTFEGAKEWVEEMWDTFKVWMEQFSNRVYTWEDIQSVYKRHHYHCGTVLISLDSGKSWEPAGMDSGKWPRNKDVRFTFLPAEK